MTLKTSDWIPYIRDILDVAVERSCGLCSLTSWPERRKEGLGSFVRRTHNPSRGGTGHNSTRGISNKSDNMGPQNKASRHQEIKILEDHDAVRCCWGYTRRLSPILRHHPPWKNPIRPFFDHVLCFFFHKVFFAVAPETPCAWTSLISCTVWEDGTRRETCRT